MPGTLQIVFWSATVGCLGATIAVNVVRQCMMSTIPKVVRGYAHIWNNAEALRKASKEAFGKMSAAGDIIKADKYSRISDALSKRAKQIENAAKSGKDVAINAPSKFSQYLSVGFAVLTVIMTIASTVMTLLDISAFYKTDYTPIPKFMVDKADITVFNEKGEEIMVKNQTAYYQAVTCNRTAGDSKITKENYETMGDRTDLNGDIGTQWLALYAVKYEYGAPILADSLVYQRGDGKVPDGYSTGIHEFGGKAATNLNNKHYLFRDNPPSIKVFFKNEKKTVEQLTGAEGANNPAATGSVFSGSSLAMGGGVGLIIGAFLGALVMGRRKKKA